MNRTGISKLIVTATLALATAGVPAAPSTAGSGSDYTPSQCIRLNAGDFNACNVGNSGRGDRPYMGSRRFTPNDCIRLNAGDFNACNVGNSGRGDQPYLPVPHHPR
jgi:roadblock/LC7 domain-containing protein